MYEQPITPPQDNKCMICKKKSNPLSYVNGVWVCKYLECVDKAKLMKGGG